MNRKKERRRRREIVILDDDDENEIARKRDNEERVLIEYINKTYLSEHARDESRFAFTLHGFLNQRDVADERFRWFDFSFLFSFFTFLFAQIGVHLGVHLVHLEKRKKSEDEFFEKKLSLREKMLRVPNWRTILNTYSKIYHQCYKLRS